METYPVDLEASQIVRWLIEEQRRGTLQLKVTATCSYAVEAFEKADLEQIGEEVGDLYQSKDELTRRDSHQRFCVIHEAPAGH